MRSLKSSRSRVLVAVAIAAALLPAGGVVAFARPGGQAATPPAARPGDPARGLHIFRTFCAGCHDFEAAGLNGNFKPGADLDERHPTFTKIVTLIVQGGGGGLPSKRLLRQLNYQQIYDVAAFIAKYAGRPGPVPGETVEPPPPVDLSAKLRHKGARGVAARFSAVLSGRGLRWHLVIPGAGAQAIAAAKIRILLPGSKQRPIALPCDPCTDPGTGFVVVSHAQAKALAKGRPLLVVSDPAIGALRARIAVAR